jgi:hypothetical protein
LLLGAALAGAVLIVAAGIWLLAATVLRVKTPEGTILLELDPADAEVAVDGRRIQVKFLGDPDAVKIDLPAGKHELKVTRGGFRVFAREVTVEGARSERVKVALVPEAQETIDRGVTYLRTLQKADGTWPFTEIGATALAAVTLLECGVPPDDPVLEKASDAIRQSGVTLTHTYSLALSIVFFDRLGDQEDIPLIESLTVRLLAGQSNQGGWTYTCPTVSEAEARRLRNVPRPAKKTGGARNRPRPRPVRRTAGSLTPEIREQLELLDKTTLKAREHADDNCNTQFAALALWVARRYGMPTEAALANVAARFGSSQNGDGGWEYMYRPRGPGSGGTSTPTMTGAGVLGLASRVAAADPTKADPDPAKDVVLRSALVTLGKAVGKPAGPGGGPVPAPTGGEPYYLLWSLERVGVAYGLVTIGGKDWYGWGRDYLVAAQKKDGSWQGEFGAYGADTCFALLFLRRADLAPDLSAALRGKVLDPGGDR